MRVDLELLRNSVNQVIEHAIEMHGGVVELPDDLYWFVQKAVVSDATKTPTDLTLGSLMDDWSELAAIGKGEKEPFGYALIWAASLLRAIGDKTY